MGYTVRSALNELGDRAQVIVAELVPAPSKSTEPLSTVQCAKSVLPALIVVKPDTDGPHSKSPLIIRGEIVFAVSF